MVAPDYTRCVSRTPPAGLWNFAVNLSRDSDDPPADLDVYGLVYEKVWISDCTPDGMIGERQGRKLPMVRCVCSACGGEELLEYMPERAWDGATYGFFHPDTQEVIKSGSLTSCPMCESSVRAKCKSKISKEGYMTAEGGCMSALLLEGQDGERPLVLIGWTARRYITKAGVDMHALLPAEAYIFDGSDCVKLMGWQNSYSGSVGYFIQYLREWRQQTNKWSESWGECNSIFGLTEELLARSCLRNAAFQEYMCGGLMGTAKYPVAYLRLFQEHPNIENLVRQKACHLLDELLGEQMPRIKWEKNKKGVAKLTDICWDQSRPSKMLGLNRDEFAMLMDRMCDAFLWRLFLACKKVGDRLEETDIENVFCLGEENIINLVGHAPIGKIARYLLRQIEQDCQLHEELYDCGDEYVPELDDYLDISDYSIISVSLLEDYWDMASVAGWDLSLPEVRWPRNLIDAHDRAMSAQTIVLEKNAEGLFLQRFKELSVFSFQAGGILIRPCRSPKELKREGEALKHCVGGYAKDVAKGLKSIFFIRRQEKPKTPWFTLQFDPKELKVIQNHGYRNDLLEPVPNEVNDFVELWLEWVRSGCKRDKNGAPVMPQNKTNKKKEVQVA